jgi:hypothetical protein
MEIATLRFEVVSAAKLDERPIVVDNEDTEDCVTESILKVFESSVEYAWRISIAFEVK